MVLAAGFSNRVDWWGENLGKMANNGMKITSWCFWVKIMGGHGGEADFLGCVIPLVPPLGENLVRVWHLLIILKPLLTLE